MTLAKDVKASIIKHYQSSANDTGSCQVQIALLTERINSLSDHFKKHSADKHSRRGLLKLVSRRRRLLNYLQREDTKQYRDLIARLNIRK